MGNCWPKPVNNLPSTNKPLTPANGEPKSSSEKFSSINHSESTENIKNGGGGGGGEVADDGRKDKYTVPQPPSASANGSAGVVQDTDSTTAPPPEAGTSGPAVPKLKMFTYAELRSATRNFRQDSVLGEGGFGTVFRGWVDEKTLAPSSKPGVGMAVAVKKSNSDSQQGLKEWQAEVKFLGKFCHPNLVRLLGYCCEDKEFLLVYEYMSKRSLENHLFRKGAGDPLPWDIRLRIAIDAARGLAFLHTTEKQVIYRDFKSANILLDGNFNAKLSDFGLAKAGPSNGNSHVTTQVVGTYGYAAPEYMATGHLYVKSDVYGFGVVLLEMISGRRVLDLNRPNGEHNLVDWAKPLLTSKKKLRKIMDTRLEGQYPSRAALQIAELIQKCLEPDPKKRPSMELILQSLEEINTLKMKSKESDQPASHRHHQDDRRSPLHDKFPSGPNRGTTTAQGHNQLSIAKTY